MRPLLRPALLVFLAALAARLTAQPANVQADPTTGALFRPSAATFISGNNLASATGGIVLGANGGTGVANTGKTLTLGGNVTTSGAFGLTLTLTAASAVTLPTTGTLATLAGSETLTNKTLTSPTLTTPTLGAATATSLTLSGNISSSAWTTNGVRLKGVAATLTDTTSTGTVTAAYTDVLGGNTIAASSATTYTDYITAFFKEPTAGSLVTMTNKWALGGESLRIGTSTPMTVSTAGAITANSLTGLASTPLTLTGGSTGASLVLGQGATAGNVTITPTGTGVVAIAGTGSKLTIAGTTASTSTTTGALTIAGGVGVAGAINLGGTAGFGGGNSGAIGLDVRYTNLSGPTQYGMAVEPVFSSSATVAANGGYFLVQSAAAAFTMAVGNAVLIDSPTVGAASAITTQTGIKINNQGAPGITNAYGIDIAAQSGAATTNIGLRNAGITSLTNSTSATSSTVGALTIGDGSAATNVAIGAGAINAGGALTVGGTVIHTLSATPASASATGTVGTMSWDANYIYICTATNTWKRVAIATW